MFDSDIIEWRASSGLQYDEFEAIFTSIFGRFHVASSLSGLFESLRITEERSTIGEENLRTEIQVIHDRLEQRSQEDLHEVEEARRDPATASIISPSPPLPPPAPRSVRLPLPTLEEEDN